jgi:N-methylhydantoinase A
MGQLIGYDDIISADMGGTTFKVGAVRTGMVDYQRESLAFRYHYALPKIDVVSLGLAGGSIIAVDPESRVPGIGPRSAGSYPGPVVYAHGGTEPTVTDVDALLGFLSEDYFLGGRAKLSIPDAEAVFAERIAEPLGQSVAAAAADMYRLTNSYIYDFLHRLTVQRGLDPRSFALFSTGGTAGMHLPIVARRLGIPTVVVPYTASVQGAFGLVTSDVVHEELVSRPLRMPADPAAVNAVFAELEAKVLPLLAAEGFSPSATTLERFVDFRYGRQVHEVTTPLLSGPGPLTAGDLDAAVDRFEALYRRRYGPDSTFAEAGVELVSYRVRAIGAIDRPDLRQFAAGGEARVEDARVADRVTLVPAIGQPAEVGAYDLDLLPADGTLDGPALVWSPITTVLLDAGQRAVVDHYRNLVITTEVDA